MPNLPNRDKYDTELTRSIAGVLAQYRGQGPKVSWTDFQDDLAEVIEPLLTEVYHHARKQVAEDLHVSDSETPDVARSWAAGYTPVLVSQLVSRTREAARNDKDIDPGPLFSLSRARNIALTEVTRATVAGEQEIAEIALLTLGFFDGPYWMVSGEGNECEVCMDLHGKGRREWSAEYPEGPPGPHPGCQCELVYYKP